MARDEEREDRRRTQAIDAALGRRLRGLREDLGLTQEAVAALLAISPIQWGRYESGESRVPAARLHQACTLLGLEVAAVFEGLPHQVTPRGAEAGGVREPAAGFEGPPTDPVFRQIGAAVRALPPARRRTALALVRALGAETGPAAENPPDEK